MISQLLRDIFRGFGRSIGWRLGGLLVLALLAFASNSARAASATIADAWAECVAHAAAYGASARCEYRKDTHPNAILEIWIPNNSINGTFTFAAGCSAGAEFNTVTGVCEEPCDGKPPLPSGTFVQDAATLTSICKDNCGYAPTSLMSVTPCKTVDGVEYCRVDGWETNSEIQCAADGSSNNSFGTPPSDGDGDGASDGNDGSPNNPGAGGGGNEDSGGSDGNSDGDESDEGEGSGNGNTSGGGGDCATPPHSTGDAILAQVAYQAWATRCAVESSKNSDGSLKVKAEGASGPIGGGTDMGETNGLLGGIKGTVDAIKDFFTGDPGQGATTGEDATAESVFTENEFGADGLDDSGFGYGGSCPPPVDIPVMGNTLTFRTDILCDWLAIGGWFVMLLTGVACLRSISEA